MNDLEKYGVISSNTNGRYREVLFGKNSESEVEKLEEELANMENTNNNESGDSN